MPAVFPAHAGMFLEELVENMLGLCFPRARGDVPVKPGTMSITSPFSPRTRRCSYPACAQSLSTTVFPAHAGMFLRYRPAGANHQGFPRARGDVPAPIEHPWSKMPFSPRTRGCSEIESDTDKQTVVFPAHAGMFLAPLNACCQKCCFPRARGDVPMQANTTISLSAFSPRTRGCSEAPGCPGAGILVFPAHAGMFRVNM